MDDVATGAWKVLSQRPEVTALLGAFPPADPRPANAGRPWLFTGNILAQVSNSSASAVVLSDYGGWSAPPQLGSQRFRRLKVDVWTDPVRDAAGNVAVTESGTVARCLAVFDALHAVLQRTDPDTQVWGDLVTFACQLLTEPQPVQVADGDTQGMGIVMGTAVYGVSVAGRVSAFA